MTDLNKLKEKIIEELGIIEKRKSEEIEKFISNFSKSLRKLLIDFGLCNSPDMDTEKKYMLKISINEKIDYLRQSLVPFKQDFKK